MTISASEVLWDDTGGKSYYDIIDEAADEFGVPRDFARKIHARGEKWRPSADVSPKGAIGPMQVMPETFEAAARELGIENPDINDREQNIRVGVYYLSKQYKDHGKNRKLTAAAYNAGPGAVQKYGGVPPYKETQKYVRDVATDERIDPKAITWDADRIDPAKIQWDNEAPNVPPGRYPTAQTVHPQPAPIVQEARPVVTEPLRYDEEGFRVYPEPEPVQQEGDTLTAGKPRYSTERIKGAVREGTKDVARDTLNGLKATIDATIRAGEGSERTRSITPPEQKPGVPFLPHIEDQFAKAGIEARQQLKGASDYIGGLTTQIEKDPRYIESAGFWEDIARQSPQVAVQVLTALSARGAVNVTSKVLGGLSPEATALASQFVRAVPMTEMGIQIIGNQYDDLIKKGVDPDRAFSASVVNALIQAPLEQIGLEKMLKTFNPSGKALRSIFEAAGTEFITEFLQEFPEAGSNVWAENPNMDTWQQVGKFVDGLPQTTKDALYSGLVGSVFGAVTGGIGAGAGKLSRQPGVTAEPAQDTANFSIPESVQTPAQTETVSQVPQQVAPTESLDLNAVQWDEPGVTQQVQTGTISPQDVVWDEPGAPPQELESPRPKEPWEMTRQEYIQDRSEAGKRSIMRIARTPEELERYGATPIDMHREAIDRALAEGKPVPSRVLDEYKIAAPLSPTHQVESELIREVDEVIGPTVPPVGLSIASSKTPSSTSPSSRFTFSDETVESEFQKYKGVGKSSIDQRLRQAADLFTRRASRVFETLPETQQFAPLQNELLKLSKQKGVASDRTLRAIQGIRINLSKETNDLFERKVILDDLYYTMQEGKTVPHPFTPEIVESELDRVDEAIKSAPEVRGAIEKRRKFWEALKKDYVKAMESIGFNVDKRFTNPSYFRHQVLEYAQAMSPVGTGAKLKTPAGRGFLKQRQGSSKPINYDYLQAEREVMTQMLFDIETTKAIKFVDTQYNIKGKLKEDEAIPEGYTEWQPREGSVFYLSDSIPARIARQLLDEKVEELGITKEDLKKVLAVGGRRREFVIPVEVAETLDRLFPQSEQNVVYRSMKALTRGWKVWQLISPRRLLKYNLRNITGDAEAIFVGNPGAFVKAPQAFSELYGVMVHDKPMSDEMRGWFGRGGMETTLQAQEMDELRNLNMFKKLYDQQKGFAHLPAKVWKRYWSAARMSTDLREATLRYAAYLDYLEQLKSSPDGLPRNYGASRPEYIKALKSIEDRAFWLSNDLLGAYDRVTELGKDLRDFLFPFWSWKEVNFKRYIQLFRNAADDGKLAEAVGRKFLGSAAKSPFTAMRVGMFLIKASAFWAMLQAYNNLRYPDEEKELPPDIRDRPHIILGRDENGAIQYFSRVGMLGDFLEWFGLDAFPKHIDQWTSGRKNLKEIAFDMASSPANVLVQSANWLPKLAGEMLTRRSLFPDFRNPGTIRDRGLYIARQFGVENEYIAINGLPSKSYVESLKTTAFYKMDPEQGAYRQILDLKRDFLKKHGSESDGFWISPKGQALYNFKLALRYEDKRAAQKYMAEYIKLSALSGQTDADKIKQGLRMSLAAMSPLFGLNEKMQQEFVTGLSEEEQKMLKKAFKFFTETLLKPTKPE